MSDYVIVFQGFYIPNCNNEDEAKEKAIKMIKKGNIPEIDYVDRY